jgi:hypothetical protein
MILVGMVYIMLTESFIAHVRQCNYGGEGAELCV